MDATLEQVWESVQQLTPQEQEELLRRLQATTQPAAHSVVDVIPILDLGPWPENLSLKRKDLYE